MPRPANSILSTLLAYANAQVPAGGIGGNLGYRNLDTYYAQKKNDSSPIPGHADRDDTKNMARRAVAACGLGAHMHAAMPLAFPRSAAAATVLAMAIIKDVTQQNLTGQFQRLSRMPERSVVVELRSLLLHGDTEDARTHPHLKLKNFTSAGLQKVRYLRDAEDAYERAYQLLMGCRTEFILNKGALKPGVQAAFNTYFGNPIANVNTPAIPWGGGAMAGVFPAAMQAKRTVVREVLRKICDVYLSQQQVRLYFGGKAIDTGTYAYVSGATNPTKIHLGGTFFGLGEVGIDSRGGTIVHELTHTFADTDDHHYGDAPCQAAAAGTAIQQLRALSNADNYQLFVETAFAL